MVRRGSHGLAPAQGVSARGVPCMRPSCQSQFPEMTIDSLQPGHGEGSLWIFSNLDWSPQRSLCLPDRTLGTSPRVQIVAVTIFSSNAVKWIHRGRCNSYMTIDFRERPSPDANMTPKVHKAVNKGDMFWEHCMNFLKTPYSFQWIDKDLSYLY